MPYIACTYGRSRVALCPHTVGYKPLSWWSRYPQETTKFWNLTNLFHPKAWMWTFLTFILVSVTLKLASLLESKLGLNVGSEEVALIPLRLNIKMNYFLYKCVVFRITLSNSPLLETLFSRGFASNMIFQIWALFGGIFLR